MQNFEQSGKYAKRERRISDIAILSLEIKGFKVTESIENFSFEFF